MENPNGDKYVFNEFEIDVSARILRSAGRPVALNARAFDLLVELIRNRGAVVSKDRLLDAVWPGQFVEENNLTVQISALRKAFGEAKGEQKYIATVPGRGYSFVAPIKDGSRALRAGTRATSADSSLFGRDHELADVLEALTDPNIRLITLTGAGGSGKTSLARVVSTLQRDAFAGGVFFIELAELRDPANLLAAIEEKIGSTNDVGRLPKESLIAFFGDKAVFLILDNFEQILAAASDVTELLSSLPRLKILVTSRSPLRVKTEREVIVRPLEVPPDQGEMNLDDLLRFPSIELFYERAREARPSFELTSENVPFVAKICQKLDGLPLAIELAAGRIKLLSPASILDRLVDSLALLSGGGSDAPDRQRTIRGTVEWSYKLLDTTERRAFRDLAVFAGGFTAAAAERVLCENKGKTSSVLDTLSNLSSNNLLWTQDNKEADPRLGMLQVIRDFASEELESNGDLPAVRSRHLDYFCNLAEEAEPHLFTSESINWLSRLESDIDNLRTALQFAADHEPDKFVCMSGALRHFWIYRSYLTEGRSWLEKALEMSDSHVASVRFKLLQGLGIMARLQGDYDYALSVYQLALAESRNAGDKRNAAMLCSGLGTVLQLKGQSREARPYFEEGLAISREIGDDYSIAYCLLCLGIVLGLENEPKAAREMLEESLGLLRDFGSKEAISNNLNNLGAVAYDLGDFDAAHAYFMEGLELSEEVGNKVNIVDAINGLAALAARDHESDLAARLAGAADKMATSIGFNKEPAERKFCEKYLTDLRESLGESVFSSSFAKGRALDRSDAVELARNSKTGTKPPQSTLIIEQERHTRITLEDD